MEKDSFIFYRDWRDAVAAYEPAIRLELYEAVMAYAFGEPMPALSPAVQMAFGFIKPQLDRNAEKYDRIAERNRANGAKGGRPKKTQQNPTEPKKPNGLFGNPKNPAKPKKADNDINNKLINKFINDNNNISSTINAQAREGFIPVAEIPAYIKAQANTAQYEAMVRELYRLQGNKMPTAEQLENLLEMFRDANSLQGAQEHETKDLFTHFIAWARIYTQAQAKQAAGQTKSMQGVTLRSDEGKVYTKI